MRITTKSEEYRDFRRQQQQENNNPFWQWAGPSKGNKKPLWKELKAGDWKWERCFIIGGGPSLIGFDFNRLEGKGKIIAVNKAFMFAPFADMMFAMDTDFYTSITQNKLGDKTHAAFHQFKGWKVWVDSNNYTFENIHYLFRWRLPEVTKDLRKGVYVGNNSGVGALMLAASLGCSPVYLLGFDGCHKGGKSHFHSGYARRQLPKTAKKFVQYFDKVRKPLKEYGCEVINLNKQSEIKAFKFEDIGKVLNGK